LIFSGDKKIRNWHVIVSDYFCLLEEHWDIFVIEIRVSSSAEGEWVWASAPSAIASAIVQI
jgi:hypothetical protein